MKKVKSLISFIGEAKTIKGRMTLVLFLLWSLVELPAFVFHELMHMLVVIPFGHNLKITDWHWYELKRDPNHYFSVQLKVYNLTMEYNSSPRIGILGSAAPLIGWFIAIILLALTHHWFVLLYFFIGIRLFFLSVGDIKAMRGNGANDYVCDVLLVIRSYLATDVPLSVN